MQNISSRTQRVGAFYGAIGFVVAVALSWWLVSPTPNEPSRLNRAIWGLLSAHMVSLGPVKSEAIVRAFPRFARVATGPLGPAWHVLPLLGAFIGSVGTNLALGRTTRREYLIQNAAMAAVGYVGAALVAIPFSNAAPTLTLPAMILGGGLLALSIGSTVVGKATRTGGGVPIIGIASLGTLALIGGVVLILGFVVVRLMLPVIMMAAGGALAASLFVYAAREYNI